MKSLNNYIKESLSSDERDIMDSYLDQLSMYFNEMPAEMLQELLEKILGDFIEGKDCNKDRSTAVGDAVNNVYLKFIK